MSTERFRRITQLWNWLPAFRGVPEGSFYFFMGLLGYFVMEWAFFRPIRTYVFGHELTHGFDDQGRKFDAKGNLKEWWTEKDNKEFTDRAQCIVDQYAQYTIVDDIKINIWSVVMTCTAPAAEDSVTTT